MRASRNKPILLDMENFPTKRLQLVPRVANLATLAVVVSATWWSGAQRPDANPDNATRLQMVSQAVTSAREATSNQAGTAQLAWPQAQTTLQPEAIKTVGFTSASLR